MKLRIVSLPVLLALFVTLALGTTVSASNDPGLGSLSSTAAPEVGTDACGGLTDYSAAMLKIGKRWIKGMERDGLAARSTRTFTATEWEDYADRADRLHTDLLAIEPPAFVAPWHEAMIDSARLKINFGRSAALVGFDYTADLLAPSVAATSTEVADARQTASSSCADFTTFYQQWDNLDGQTAASEDAKS